MQKLFFLFSILALSIFSLKPNHAKEETSLFEEKIFTVTSEQDYIKKGTLRWAILEAKAWRQGHPFSKVRIRFDASVKRLRISQGPLPDLESGMTTLDCSHPEGRVLLEGYSEDILTKADLGLRISSSGNTILSCHWTGFHQGAIEILAPRNQIYNNVFGYDPQYEESKALGNLRYGEPKPNRGAGLLLGEGAWASHIENNHFVALGASGILLKNRVGGENQFFKNYFFQNQAEP
ncbi:MAG: hypothetical protein KDK66_07340, partial [Deltaproteobacteria bacterium]|nr:hypothetical protein [Deltaproteobacteria bacterium]